MQRLIINNLAFKYEPAILNLQSMRLLEIIEFHEKKYLQQKIPSQDLSGLIKKKFRFHNS